MKTTPLPVTALCVSGRSIYHHLSGVDAYDSSRDARSFNGRGPVVAHPPCRTWSKYLRQFAKPIDLRAEQDLAFFCLEKVMQNGGVLEQPAGSHFWNAAKLPAVGDYSDPFCFTVYVEQRWFGYSSRKPTWLLFCGIPRSEIPVVPFSLDNSSLNISQGSSFQRSRTMESFAKWLCQSAGLSWFQHR